MEMVEASSCSSIGSNFFLAHPRKRKQTTSKMSTSGARGHVEGARWTNELEILFIDLMYKEVLRRNLLGSTFTPAVWLDIQNNLNTQGGFWFSVKQLRGKFTRIKKHWCKFRTLMLSDTDLGWDSERELPTANDNWWAIWEQAHPQDIGLRNKPCRRYLKLCELFIRNTTTGQRARSSAQLPPRMEGVRYGTSNDAIDIEDEDEGIEGQTPTRGFGSASTAGSFKRWKSQKQAQERLIDSMEKSNSSFSSWLDEASKENESIQMQCTQCMNALRALPDVSIDMVVAAARYFEEPDNRTLFLLLSPIEQRALISEISR